jgi:hypothetical protein
MLKLLAVFLVTLLSVEAFAVNITTLDGKTYKNAEVIQKMQNGIIISYKDADGFNDVLHLNFKNLSKEAKAKYGYKTKIYNKYEKQHEVWINSQHEKAHKTKVKAENFQKYVEKLTAETNRITSMLNGKKIKIVFSSLSIIDGGTVGWARVVSSMGTEQQSLGRICLLGQTVSPTDKWYGYVCPVGTTKKFNIGTTDQSNSDAAEYLPSETRKSSNASGESNNKVTPPPEGEINVPCYADYKTALKLSWDKVNLNAHQK